MQPYAPPAGHTPSPSPASLPPQQLLFARKRIDDQAWTWFGYSIAAILLTPIVSGIAWHHFNRLETEYEQLGVQPPWYLIWGRGLAIGYLGLWGMFFGLMILGLGLTALVGA